MCVCPVGHMPYIKQNRGKRKEHGSKHIRIILTRRSANYSKQEGCYKKGAKSKTYSVPIKTDEQLHQMEFQQTERFKEKVTKRYKIEAINAELKQVYSYDRAQSYGLSCMNLQGAMSIFAANMGPL